MHMWACRTSDDSVQGGKLYSAEHDLPSPALGGWLHPSHLHPNTAAFAKPGRTWQLQSRLSLFLPTLKHSHNRFCAKSQQFPSLLFVSCSSKKWKREEGREAGWATDFSLRDLPPETVEVSSCCICCSSGVVDALGHGLTIFNFTISCMWVFMSV